MNHSFAVFTAEDMPQWWDRIAQLIAPAVEKNYGQATLDDVRAHIDSGDYLSCGMSIDGELVLAVVLSRAVFDRQTWCHVAYIGGRHLKVFAEHYFPFIKKFAKESGCAGVQCTCQENVARLILRYDKHHEATRAYTVLRTGV